MNTKAELRLNLTTIFKLLLISGIIIVLAACGKEKPDVSIFILPPAGMQADIAEVLETSLKDAVGETPTTALYTSPIFDMQKLTVEIAAADHGIVIIPEEQFRLFAVSGGLLPLDEYFNPDDYPEGVVEVEEDGEKGTFLLGIPLAEGEWLKSVGYKGQEMVAFVHPRAPDVEQALQVLNVIVDMN